MKFRLHRIAVVALCSSLIAYGATNELEFSSSGGDVKGKLNALLQVWTLNDSTVVPGSTQFNYRLRRAEIKLSGSVVDKTKFFVMLDPAKAINPASTNPGDRQILQDLGVTFSIVPGLDITAGQFKVLTTAEGLNSSADLLFPERSLVGRVYGDRRDPGAMIAYQTGVVKAAAMVSNGQGTNAATQVVNGGKTTKDLSARVDVAVTPEVKVGTYVLLGDFQTETKSRWGINSRLNVGGFTASAEYSLGRDTAINSQGVVVDVGLMVGRDFQPVARYEAFQPNVGNGAFICQAETLGLNYFVTTNKNAAKIQGAVGALQGMNGTNGSSAPALGVNGVLATFVFQASI